MKFSKFQNSANFEIQQIEEIQQIMKFSKFRNSANFKIRQIYEIQQI